MAKHNEGESKKKMVTRREFLVGGGAVLAAAALVACSTKTTSTVTAPSTKASTTTLSSKYGGTLRKIVGGLPTGNPGGWPAEMSTGSDESRIIFEGLLRMDNKGNTLPWLAESYKVADDMKSITFTLRKGVKFHDGTDFNAQAAKWNVDNVITAKSVTYFDSADVIDDYTIRVNLTKWSNLVWSNFDEDFYCLMVSPTAFQKHGKDWMINNPVGTGPFKFVSFESQVSYKFAKNQDYWMKDGQGNQLPYLDAAEVTYISDPLTQKVAMQAGEGDMTDLSISSGKTAADYEAAGLKIKTGVGSTIVLMADTAHADSPYANKMVREAVEYAIDRESIAKAFSYGYWQAPYQIPGPACAAYNANFTLGRKYDPEKAKQLLAEAGYPNGFKTTIPVMPVPLDRNSVVAVQSYLSEVGIQAELGFTTSFPGFLDQMNSLHSVLNLLALPDNFANFNMPLDRVIGTTSILNMNWLKTDEFLKLFQASLDSVTPDVNLMRAVTGYLVQEAFITPIMGSGLAIVTQPYVMDTGFLELSYPPCWKPEQAWLKKD